MIAYLEGQVIERVADAELVVFVTAGVSSTGVGYRITTDARGDAVGDHVRRWIHSITKEETGTTLFGFETTEERNRFVELLGVDGVGPKTAFAILKAGANPRDLAQLVAVKGVGKKTAEKIIEQLGAAA